MTSTSSNEPVRYAAGFEIYRDAGMAKTTFGKLSAGPWCPWPDIFIGLQPGWKRDRAQRWLRETGRIDAEGRPQRARRRRPDEVPPEWYRCLSPRRYLTAGEAAMLLGHERKTIGRLKATGHGLEAAVVVGDLEGYHIDAVVLLGEQFGWIEPGGAMVRAAWETMVRDRNRMVKFKRMCVAEVDAADVTCTSGGPRF